MPKILGETTLWREFRRFDLIYGSSPIRGQLIARKKQVDDYFPPTSIDEINNHLLDIFSNFLRLLPRDMAHPEPDSPERLFRRELTAFKEACATFKKKDPGYHKHLTFLLTLDKPRHKKLCFDSNHFLSRDSHTFRPENRRVRRLCKAALLRSDITTHFCLDDINAQYVFLKGASSVPPAKSSSDTTAVPIRFRQRVKASRQRSSKPKPTHTLYESFTSAELRFIIKNWHEIISYTRFYQNGEPLCFFQWVLNWNAEKAFLDYLASKDIVEDSLTLTFNSTEHTFESWKVYTTTQVEIMPTEVTTVTTIPSRGLLERLKACFFKAPTETSPSQPSLPKTLHIGSAAIS